MHVFASFVNLLTIKGLGVPVRLPSLCDVEHEFSFQGVILRALTGWASREACIRRAHNSVSSFSSQSDVSI